MASREQLESEAKASLSVLAFDRDTQIELAKALARHWVISHFLRTTHLPNGARFYAYPSQDGFSWGGDKGDPMHGKRVVISLEIENEASHD